MVKKKMAVITNEITRLLRGYLAISGSPDYEIRKPCYMLQLISANQ